MIRRPPRSTQPTTLFPYTTLFRSEKVVAALDAALTSPVESPEPLLRALANAKQALTLGAAPAAFSARSLSVRA
jgi:hypothetical protein